MAPRRTSSPPTAAPRWGGVILLAAVGCTGSGVVADVVPPTPTETPTAVATDPPVTPTAVSTPTEVDVSETPTATEGATNTEDTPTEGGTPGAAGVLHVPGTYATIQAAIDAAQSRDEIRVAPGTYTEDINFHGKVLVLSGTGGPGSTILKGTGSGSVVTLATAEQEGTTLRGLTITGGVGTTDEGGFRVGGGIYIDGARPTVEDCLITGNRADYGAGIGVEGGELTLSQVRFYGNQGDEYGGAMSIRDAHLSARQLLVWDNHARQGGAMYVNDVQGEIRNSLFSANHADDAGGAISLRYADTDFLMANNVFAENSAPAGSAVYYFASEATLTSNIITANFGSEALYLDSDNFSPPVTYNDVAQNPGGNYGGKFNNLATRSGNIAEDPRFESFTADGDPFNDLLTLADGSPCIDAGPEGAAWEDTDGSRNDMGMYGGPWADSRAYTDQDGDGMPDLWEDLNGLDSGSDDSQGDLDGDGLINIDEYLNGTQVDDPDTDDDGVNDGDELAAGGDPLDDRDNRPVADAGNDYYTERGETATLDGSGSRDPNGDPLTYQWTLVFGPDGSTVTQSSLVGADQVQATFNPDVDGSYAFDLVVSDGRASSVPDRVIVTTAGSWYVPGPGLPTIQAAIERASNGERILVAPGTYEETLEFNNKRVRVESVGGPEVTILRPPRGGGQSVVNFKNNLRNREDGHVEQLVGFTVTAGLGTFLEFELYGGGIFVTSSAPIIEDCIITRNGASNGGGIAVIGGGLTLRDSRIEYNGADEDGAGIYVQASLLPVLIERNLIQYNRGDDGGGLNLIEYPIATIRNNLFRGNYNKSASGGGAVSFVSADENVEFTNNVLVENEGPVVAGVIARYGAPYLAGNIIAWNKVGAGVSLPVDVSADLDFSYNDVYGNEGGNYGGRALAYANRDGNVSVDPQFARYVPGLDEQNALFFLKPSSPVIDAGPQDVRFRDVDGSRNDMGLFGGPGALQAGPADEDEDGMADYWEEDNGLDPFVNDAALDPDGDGLNNGGEFDAGSDPHAADTDGDGISDGAEVSAGQDPIDASDNAPVAEVAEPFLYVDVGGPTELDGSASSDPQDEPLTYKWEMTRAPASSALTTADISGADQPVASFVPDVQGSWDIKLTVSDGHAWSAPAMVTVYASETLIVGEPGTHDSIQAAIDDAVDNSQIRVRAGTWVEDLDFKGKTLIVESMDGPEATTIRGTSLGPVVSFVTGEGPSSALIGFTITGGTGLIQVADDWEGSVDRLIGGGIYVSGASPTFSDLIIRQNSAEYGGGVFASGGSPTFEDVIIEDNDAAKLGGGVCLEGSGAHFVRGEIRGNRGSEVAGIQVSGGAPTITNTIVQENRASAVSGVGGLAVAGCEDELSLSNLTVVGNNGRQASSLWMTGCTGAVVNTIFAFGTSGFGVVVSGGVTPYFVYNDVHGHAAGDYGGDMDSQTSVDGNISAAPQFLGYSSGDGFDDDLRLAPTSPCVNTGDPGPYWNDPDGSRNDMGAYGGPDAPTR